VIFLGEGGSDDNSDRPKVLQSNPPLSRKALMYQHYLESKQNDTFMNVPGDNVVTDVISPGGGGSHDKSNGPTILPSNSPLSGKKLLYQHDLEKGKGGKYRTGNKLASSVTSQCLYHDVFTMYLHHFLPNDHYFLRYIVKQIITNSMSPPNRCTVTPVAKINAEVDSWTTTRKATTACSSLGFEDNVCEENFPPSLLTKYTVVVRIIKLPFITNPNMADIKQND
jgi:hypothetical protein